MIARRLLLHAYLTARGVALMPLRILPRRPLPRDWRKILLVRIDRIGDLVLSTPFLRNLREAVPAAEIVLLGAGAAPELLSDETLVDRIVVHTRTGDARRTLESLRTHQFDLALDMHCDYILAPALLARRVRARCSVGFDVGGRGALFDLTVPAPARKHFVDETFDLLRALGITPRAHSPEIAVHPRALGEAQAILTQAGVSARYVAFHPGGFYPEQRWPAMRFARLADLVSAQGLTPVFLGGQDDASLLQEISGSMKGRGAFVCGRRFGVAAAVIARSALFVGNNSGPLHVACALNIPSVSTMGPTDPVRFWPLSKRACVVRARIVEHISVEEMFAAIKDALA